MHRLLPGCGLLSRAVAVPQSTLMRSIASGKLDGFPPKEVLKTVYVEHDIDASAAETAVVDFVMRDPMLEGATGLPWPDPTLAIVFRLIYRVMKQCSRQRTGGDPIRRRQCLVASGMRRVTAIEL